MQLRCWIFQKNITYIVWLFCMDFSLIFSQKITIKFTCMMIWIQGLRTCEGHVKYCAEIFFNALSTLVFNYKCKMEKLELFLGGIIRTRYSLHYERTLFLVKYSFVNINSFVIYSSIFIWIIPQTCIGNFAIFQKIGVGD